MNRRDLDIEITEFPFVCQLLDSPILCDHHEDAWEIKFPITEPVEIEKIGLLPKKQERMTRPQRLRSARQGAMSTFTFALRSAKRRMVLESETIWHLSPLSMP